MRSNPTDWRWWRKVLLLSLFLSVPWMGLAKTKGPVKVADSNLSGIIRPDLLNAAGDPTLRFPVMNTSGSTTYGWLDITSSSIRYTEVQPTRRSGHAFEVSRLGIRELRFDGTVLSFKDPKKLQTMSYLAQERWGIVHSASGGLSKEGNRESLGTQSIYDTLTNFEGVLALVKPPPPPAPVVVQTVAPPAPKPAAPPSPPAIVLSSPPGAGENQILEWAETTVVIRGVAMDSTGIPVVRINGSPANMRPQTTQAAEFWSEPITLQPGRNPIQIVATNSGHVDSRLAVTVDYKPRTVTEKPKTAAVNPRALDRLEIIGLLQGAVPPTRVLDLVRERGIKFAPTSDDLNAIRAAGATDDLIEAIRQAAPHP